MKRILMMALSVMLLFTGCGKGGDSAPSASDDPSQGAVPGSYTVPEGWVKSEKYSTDAQLFYIEEGHEEDETPDNISIHVGENQYALEEHAQFRDAIVQQLLVQLDGIEAELNGDGCCNGTVLHRGRLWVLPDSADQFQWIGISQ